MNAEALDAAILGPAFLAGLLVLATHVPLGMRVLARGIVFIDLAIAQIAGLGVIAGDLAGWEPQGAAVQVCAVGAALAGALLLNLAERRWPAVQEATIGVVFVLAASGSVLLLAQNPHGGEHLRDLLAGQILWVGYRQLLPAALLTAAILAIWQGRRGRVGRLGFYVLFALAVTASVQLVGIYLVFASLIIPALACRELPPRRRLAAGLAMGAAGYAAGLVASALFDLPSGAVIVWMLALAGAAVHALQRMASAPGAEPGAATREDHG